MPIDDENFCLVPFTVARDDLEISIETVLASVCLKIFASKDYLKIYGICVVYIHIFKS